MLVGWWGNTISRWLGGYDYYGTPALTVLLVNPGSLGQGGAASYEYYAGGGGGRNYGGGGGGEYRRRGGGAV